MSEREPELSVVLPVFNEQQLVGDTVSEIIAALGQESYEVVLVDDGSTDDTWPIIQALSREHDRVRGVRFTRNFGHQSALVAGMFEARGRAIITMDSDGEHPPALLAELVDRWRAGAVIVQAIRTDSAGIPPAKRLTSRWFYAIFSWLAETEIRPGSADFRLLDRRVVDLLRTHPNASHFLRGFVSWTGFDTEYVEFIPRRRAAGETKFSSSKMLGLARQGILGFSIKPLRVSMLLGGMTCAFSLIYLLYIVTVRLFFKDMTIDGWASVTGLLALLGGVQLLVIGILGEYVGIIFETLRDPPRYIIAERCAHKDDNH